MVAWCLIGVWLVVDVVDWWLLGVCVCCIIGVWLLVD